MSTTVNNIIYCITSYEDKTASIGNGNGYSNAVRGELKENVFFEEFVEISEIKYQVTNISRMAFVLNEKIRTLIIHSKIRIIQAHAFDQCRKVESVIFTEGSKLTIIDDVAFYNCSMKSIVIPGSVKYIGEFSFVACDKLEYFFYCGKYEITPKVFDYKMEILDPTPNDVKIYLTKRYKFDLFGQRKIFSRNYESCLIRKCTNQKTNHANLSKLSLLIIMILSN